MTVRFCDEQEFGFGWILPEPALLQKASHVLASEGRVWLVDPDDADGVEARVRELGEPAGVIQLLDRHNRGCETWAERLGVPHHVVPVGRLDGTPFQFLVVRKGRTWKESALWWPERRVLALGDALGTAPYYLARGDRLAVHPLLRPIPPRKRVGIVSPAHVLCGHGEGVHGDDAEPALREALATARRRIPGQLAAMVREARRARRD